MIETRRFSYAAYHVLRNPALDDAENDALFGKCARGHGHTYTILVSLDTERISWDRVHDRIEALLASLLDYQDLNRTIDPLPSGERVLSVLWQRLERELSEGGLVEIQLVETGKNKFSISKGEAIWSH